MNFNIFLTYTFIMLLTLSNKNRYTNMAQLNSLLVRSYKKIPLYLFISNLKRDIFTIVTVLLIVILAPIDTFQKVMLILVYGVTQFVYRTFQYLNQKNSIFVLSTPFIISTLLNNAYLLSVCTISTSISLISAAFNASKIHDFLDISDTKDKSHLFIIGLSSTVFSIIMSYSPLSRVVSLSQILPIITLLLTTYIENIITSNKDHLIKYKSYFSLYRLKVRKISLNLLGSAIKRKFIVVLVAYIPMLIIYMYSSKNLINSLALIFVLLLVIYSNLDLLTYHYLSNESIVYANSVTRFIVVQIPNFIAFSYVIFSSVQSQINDSYYLSSLKLVNISFMGFSLLLCIFYHVRLSKIISTKK